jgi:hypothetical protein
MGRRTQFPIRNHMTGTTQNTGRDRVPCMPLNCVTLREIIAYGEKNSWQFLFQEHVMIVVTLYLSVTEMKWSTSGYGME